MVHKTLRTEDSLFVKPICPRGHDKRIVGVYSDYGCVECKKPRNRKKKSTSLFPKSIRGRYCVHGHDKTVVGVSKYSSCLACKREQGKRYRHPGLSAVIFRYCPRGHDKYREGVGPNGQCAKCRRGQESRRKDERSDNHPNSKSKWIYLDKLKRVRDELGISKRRLALYCGLDATFIRRLENCTQQASVEVQEKIVKGVSRAQKDVRRERRLRGDIYGAKLGRSHAA